MSYTVYNRKNKNLFIRATLCHRRNEENKCIKYKLKKEKENSNNCSFLYLLEMLLSILGWSISYTNKKGLKRKKKYDDIRSNSWQGDLSLFYKIGWLI